MIEKVLARSLSEPAKFFGNIAQAIIVVLAFVAIVFFDKDQATTIAAATGVIALIEAQARLTRSKVTPVAARGDEALPVGGPGGDPSIPPLTLPLDYAEAAETGELAAPPYNPEDEDDYAPEG